MDGEGEDESDEELIEDILPAKGMFIIGGQSTAGKSFVAIDMAVAVASCGAFFEKQVRPEAAGSVIYAAAEAGRTIRPRVRAAKAQRGIIGNLPIAVFTKLAFPSTDKDEAAYIEALKAEARAIEADTGHRLCLLIIDTLTAAYAIKNENDNSEIASIMKRAKAVGDALDTLVGIVHHFGKDVGSGLRGGSALKDFPDVVFYVKAEGEAEAPVRHIQVAKVRDERPDIFHHGFRIISHDVGVTRYGKPMIRGAVELMEYIPPEDKGEKPKGGRPPKNGAKFDAAFKEMMHSGKTFSMLGSVAILRVKLADMRAHFIANCAEGSASADAARKAWNRQMKIIDDSYTQYSVAADPHGERWIWRPKDAPKSQLK